MKPLQMALPVSLRDLAEVDTIVNRAVVAGNPLIATDYGNSLSKTIVLKGVALAKLFYKLRDSWPLFRAAGIDEDFVDFVDAHMDGVTGGTAEKYANMYESVFVKAQISPALKEQLAYKPIKTLLLLTAAVREGTLSEDQLSDVVLKTHSGVRSLVREARGDATSSNTAVYARLVQREHSSYPQGSIVVFGPGMEMESIGWLNLNPRTEAAKKYLERIKNTLGLEDIR